MLFPELARKFRQSRSELKVEEVGGGEGLCKTAGKREIVLEKAISWFKLVIFPKTDPVRFPRTLGKNIDFSRSCQHFEFVLLKKCPQRILGQSKGSEPILYQLWRGIPKAANVEWQKQQEYKSQIS